MGKRTVCADGQGQGEPRERKKRAWKAVARTEATKRRKAGAAAAPAKAAKAAKPGRAKPPKEGGAVGGNWAQFRAAAGEGGPGKAAGGPKRKPPKPRGPKPPAGAKNPLADAGGRPVALAAVAEPTATVAMDCEMVAVGNRSALARVSVVNNHGTVLLDSYCRPAERITDFHTALSGIRPADLKAAPAFAKVQKKVGKLLKGRTVVGHALNNDFAVLQLRHPKHAVRDTARYPPLKRRGEDGKLRPRALRELAAEQLGLEIQSGAHCSVVDARAALYLYHKHAERWEAWRGEVKGVREGGEDGGGEGEDGGAEADFGRGYF